MEARHPDEIVSAVAGRAEDQVGRGEICKRLLDDRRGDVGTIGADDDDTIRASPNRPIDRGGHPGAEIAAGLRMQRDRRPEPALHRSFAIGRRIGDFNGERRGLTDATDDVIGHDDVGIEGGGVADAGGEARLDASCLRDTGEDDEHVALVAHAKRVYKTRSADRLEVRHEGRSANVASEFSWRALPRSMELRSDGGLRFGDGLHDTIPMSLTPEEPSALECADAMRRLWDYLDRDLAEEDADAIERHLAVCAQCRPHVVFGRRLLREIAAVRPVHDALPSLRDRIVGALAGLESAEIASAAGATAGHQFAADFAAVMLPHLDAVARFSLSMTRDRADADDLVQETYLNAFRGWHTFKRDRDARRWLFTICRNEFVGGRAARAALFESHDGDIDALLAVRGHADAMANGFGAVFEEFDVGPAIGRAIGRLSEPYHSVLVLVDLEGHTYREAAEVLGVPVGTVRSRLFRGRRIIQEALLAHAEDAGLVRRGTR